MSQGGGGASSAYRLASLVLTVLPFGMAALHVKSFLPMHAPVSGGRVLPQAKKTEARNKKIEVGKAEKEHAEKEHAEKELAEKELAEQAVPRQAKFVMFL